MLENIITSTNIPLLTALILGLLVAINPCQLAINVSALTYIIKKDTVSKDKWTHPLLYILGRSLTYTIMAWTLICLIGGGKNIEAVQVLLSKGEDILPYFLILMGAFFLYRGIHVHRHEHGDDCHNCGQIIQRNGPLGALTLGLTLALAFCPESAVFYFGLMLPLATTSTAGLLVPPVFAVGAALPVLCIAFIMQKATDKAKSLSHSMEHLQRVLNILTGVIFVIIAVLLLNAE